MEEGLRSDRPSGLVVKNRSSSGCLIVRKKSVDGVGGVGPAGSRKVFESKKQKKRLSLVLSDSGSSDELFPVPQRRVGPETIRVCSGLSTFEKDIVDESEIGRKRDRLDHVRHYEEGMTGRNGFDESISERGNLDIFEFDEYDGFGGQRMRRKHFNDSGIKVGGRRFLGSMDMARSGIDREYETGSSRHGVYKRKNLYCDPAGGLNLGDGVDNTRVKMNRDGTQLPLSLLREKLMGHSDKPIRVQGKNGVLKVMVNKKKRFGGPLEDLDHHIAEESRKGSRIEDIAKRNAVIHSSSYTEKKFEKPGLVFHSEKSQMALQKSLSSKNGKDGEWDSENSDASLKLTLKNVEANSSKKRIRSEEEKTSPSLKLRSKNVEAHSSRKRIRCEEEKTPPSENLPQAIIKEGKARRGSGTEKQKLRERIREMLLSAGWTIDYRPRRNRDYLDAVYINPSGTAYWSIIKAYDAYQKQLKDEDGEAKPSGDCSSFSPISDEILSQLTRKTRKKIEKEMKKKQRDCSDSDNATEAAEKRFASTKRDVESMDSISHEEKLSSFIKQGGKSLKNRMTENGSASVNSKSKGQNAKYMHDGIEKPSSGSNPRMPHARKSRKLGRCTLLVRSSNKAQSSDADGFVPYTGKRTLLSWLIDSGTVGLSQKVQYMNRRRTRVMLEGWITRDGIHCGCCSKILTVSKFEIHAGSKLRQPFQHIYLDSGVSLLQCQIDAWNRQEDSLRIDFHSIDTDGDDPNDDTCGICGDGGDLICCDGCPSTFHLSCLDIRMLPPGDWHCPNCTCKFCGAVSGSGAQGDACALLKCSVCEKKYHKSCMLEMDAIHVDSSSLVSSFCQQKCKELFEHLQKYRGVRHELEAGFSWSLIHRTDKDSDTSLRGLPQRVECNSKLAVAQTVMDECFLPIVDRRSGINLLHNVLYNSGSNFNRLNYSGFYTAILERGDEIISAASIRFHGTKLAEMPFIGTRHVYRRQGMCRRLFAAIESALCSLKVEKLIIPAIAELMHTWTVVFGFAPLEESLKQEMISMNMLVFPGTDMLQKPLLEQESIEGNVTCKTSAKQKVCNNKLSTKPEVESKSDMDSPVGHDSRGCNSAGHDPHGCDEAGLCCANEITDEGAFTDNKSNLHADPHRFDGASHCSNELTDEVTATDNKSGMDSTAVHDPLGCDDAGLPCANEVNDDVGAADSSSLDASYEVNIPVSVQLTTCFNSYLVDKLAQSASGKKFMSPSDMIHDALEQGNKLEMDCPVIDDGQSWKENDMDEALEVNINIDCLESVPSLGEISAENTTKEINQI
ncbi:increased DNA methylation 1-like isoform X1 [Juglans microcarpa x Juglans regia]|uniref:increased DNA methylation 1-like isoform X1 n=1 Tax=Juglans microcarpa x Juglans regia TaxID=2249226 RepID=UPI001B7E8609|nr:increased DNA methylation 1-like isoform X1 [Juglans microcarpa x Juglans regia]XP_040999649.1 increased DNA methylation 1-like isoform X1 [Juglans microcarpa x Juglans regia]